MTIALEYRPRWAQGLMFKIDYYDKSLNFHSPNPADPSVTERIITIMRADEY